MPFMRITRILADSLDPMWELIYCQMFVLVPSVLSTPVYNATTNFDTFNMLRRSNPGTRPQEFYK